MTSWGRHSFYDYTLSLTRQELSADAVQYIIRLLSCLTRASILVCLQCSRYLTLSWAKLNSIFRVHQIPFYLYVKGLNLIKGAV